MEMKAVGCARTFVRTYRTMQMVSQSRTSYY